MDQKKPQPARPLTPEEAPDTARSYERAKPQKEHGMGKLDGGIGVPMERADTIDDAVGNRQNGARQLNAHDDPGGTGGSGQPSVNAT